jgi:hypothetical protein
MGDAIRTQSEIKEKWNKENLCKWFYFLMKMKKKDNKAENGFF